MRRLPALVLVTSVTLVSALLPPAQWAVGGQVSEAAGFSVPSLVDDADTPGQPVAPLAAEADPAESSDGLETTVSDLPGPGVEEVTTTASWEEVADTPLEIRQGPELRDETDELPVEVTLHDSRATGISLSVTAGEPFQDAPAGETGASNAVFTTAQAVVDEPSGPSEAPEPGEPVVGMQVRLSYAQFAELYGGAWSERLQVLAYPACHVTTPNEPKCHVQVPVPIENDRDAQILTFTTIDPESTALGALASGAEAGEPDPTGGTAGNGASSFGENGAAPEPAAALRGRQGSAAAISNRTGTLEARPTTSRADLLGGTQVATATAPAPTEWAYGTVYDVAGGAGDFGATPLSVAGSWQVGAGSGEFAYSYPFEVPAAFDGTKPALSLGYSSGVVDGMTTAENGQASSAGLGWNLNVGAITRSYTPCNRAYRGSYSDPVTDSRRF